MKQTLRLDLSQRLSMTPALQQAIRMLQLSSLDLKSEIQDALESNVMLESEEPEPVATAADTTTESLDSAGAGPDADIPDNLPLDTDWGDIYGNGSAPATAANAGDEQNWRDLQQANLTAAPDLHAHLTWQADMQPLSALQRQLASHIIDAIDSNGMLTDWPELERQLVGEYALDAQTIDQTLAIIQDFDPPGVAARGLAECLAIQLHQLDASTPARELALTIVEGGHLSAMADGRTNGLAHRLHATPQDMDAALTLLQTLQPYPGEGYSQPQTDYIIPEVFVMRQHAGWHVWLNPEIAPRLRINAHYLGVIENTASKADRSTLKSHLQEARFFLNSLKSRNETLLRVAQCIVEAQRGFLDYGEEAMKPLVLSDVSSQLDIHESTVSRATANKFMQTPRGIFELKYFFSSKLSTTDGGNASATAIQAIIRRLIAAERPNKPLSDSKLADMLRSEAGIKVARRTVAKYREELAIAPSHQRKRKPQ